MLLYFMLGNDYGERVVGNLINSSTFCEACGLACNYCRSGYGSFASDILGVDEEPKDLPFFIESPEKYLPSNLPVCDVVVAVGIHPDLLVGLPLIIEKTGARGVIVPVEDRSWCPPGLQRQLENRFCEMGVDFAFPKPFCSLKEGGGGIIDAFVRRYKIGRPLLTVDIVDGKIFGVHVVRSAPCGSTWYVAQQIRWCKISRIEEDVAMAHHAYPCTASMQIDPEFGETILHRAGYIIREVVKNAIDRVLDEERTVPRVLMESEG